VNNRVGTSGKIDAIREDERQFAKTRSESFPSPLPSVSAIHNIIWQLVVECATIPEVEGDLAKTDEAPSLISGIIFQLLTLVIHVIFFPDENVILSNEKYLGLCNQIR